MAKDDILEVEGKVLEVLLAGILQIILFGFSGSSAKSFLLNTSTRFCTVGKYIVVDGFPISVVPVFLSASGSNVERSIWNTTSDFCGSEFLNVVHVLQVFLPFWHMYQGYSCKYSPNVMDSVDQ